MSKKQVSDPSASKSSNVLAYAPKVLLAGLAAYIFYELRNFAKSPLGKTLGKLVGAVARDALYLANHPVLFMIGAFLLFLLPILGTYSKYKIEKLRERIDPLIKAENDGKLEGKDPKAVEAAAAESVHEGIVDAINETPNIPEQEKQAQENEADKDYNDYIDDNDIDHNDIDEGENINKEFDGGE